MEEIGEEERRIIDLTGQEQGVGGLGKKRPRSSDADDKAAEAQDLKNEKIEENEEAPPLLGAGGGERAEIKSSMSVADRALHHRLDGDRAFGRGDWQGAITSFQQAITIAGPWSPASMRASMHVNSGLAYQRSGLEERAAEEFETASGLERGWHVPSVLRGFSLLRQNKTAPAHKSFKE